MLAGLMMAGSILLGVEARLAKTDAMLLFTTVAAMGALARVYLAPRDAAANTGWVLPAIFWTALAGGILLKGPLILMVVGLAAMTLSIIERSGRWLLALRPLAGVAWLVLLVLPWFVAIYIKAGDSFLVDSVGEDMFAKITGGQETHGAPPGTYLLLFFATFWPASMLAGLAAPAIWRERRSPAARFLLAWLVPSWIVFEAVMTKLPHYVLPLYPAIAILIAGAVEKHVLSQRPWLVRGTMWWFLVPVIASIALVIAAVVIGRQLDLFVVAVLCGRDRFRPAGVAVVRCGRTRTRVLARHCGRSLAGDGRLCGDRAFARRVVSERRTGQCPAHIRLQGSGRGVGRL